MEENIFYVYAHYKPGDNVPFYIGKGCGKRAWTKGKNNRSVWWFGIINKYGYKVELLQENITELQSIQLEIDWIAFYGRQDLKSGPLINMTDGGDGGMLGYIRSKETRRKISEAKRGNKNMLGKHHSEEVKKKMSKSHKGKIKSEEHRRNLSKSHLGKVASEETRKKLSESHKGQIPWNKGKSVSKETRRKISEAGKGRTPWNRGKHSNGA